MTTKVRRKVATLFPFVVDVRCPHCHELVIREQSDQGYGWEVSTMIPGEEFMCNECLEWFELPDKIEEVEL